MIDDPFVTHRGLLFTVAYEMLGSAVDAEDVVQETWLRWADVDQAEGRDPRAYLVRIVTRQALNRLRSGSRRREGRGGAAPRRGPGDRAPCPRACRGAGAANAGGPSPAAGSSRDVHGRHLQRR